MLSRCRVFGSNGALDILRRNSYFISHFRGEYWRCLCNDRGRPYMVWRITFVAFSAPGSSGGTSTGRTSYCAGPAPRARRCGYTWRRRHSATPVRACARCEIGPAAYRPCLQTTTTCWTWLAAQSAVWRWSSPCKESPGGSLCVGEWVGAVFLRLDEGKQLSFHESRKATWRDVV